MGITIKGILVKAHNLIGIVKRYYRPLRRVYQIITAEIPEINKDIALQMAFKALNNFTGPNGLIPTLLVFGAYLQLINTDIPLLTVSQRANALKKAIEEIKKIQAKYQVMDTLSTYNSPNTTTIHNLPLNSPILV